MNHREEFRYVVGRAHEIERVVARNHLCPRCGHKVPYYSKEAAEAKLRELVAQRIIEYGEVSERDYYLCHPRFRTAEGYPVYHLTSQVEGRVNTSVKEKKLAREWGQE